MTIISFHNFSPPRANKKGAPTRLNLIGTPKRGTTQLKRVNNSFSLLPVANGTVPAQSVRAYFVGYFATDTLSGSHRPPVF